MSVQVCCVRASKGSHTLSGSDKLCVPLSGRATRYFAWVHRSVGTLDLTLAASVNITAITGHIILDRPELVLCSSKSNGRSKQSA